MPGVSECPRLAREGLASKVCHHPHCGRPRRSIHHARLPDKGKQTFANFSRFTQAGAKPWALTLKLNKTKSTEVAKARKIHSQIQKVILEDLPAIPLWYNGMWSQYNTSVWTSFPAAGTKAQFTPTVWNGYLNMTGIDALASLRLKKT